MWDRFGGESDRHYHAGEGSEIRLLFDELLQNFQGLVLSFDAATNRLPEGAPRTMLDTMSTAEQNPASVAE